MPELSFRILLMYSGNGQNALALPISSSTHPQTDISISLLRKYYFSFVLYCESDRLPGEISISHVHIENFVYHYVFPFFPGIRGKENCLFHHIFSNIKYSIVVFVILGGFLFKAGPGVWKMEICIIKRLIEFHIISQDQHILAGGSINWINW